MSQSGNKEINNLCTPINEAMKKNKTFSFMSQSCRIAFSLFDVIRDYTKQSASQFIRDLADCNLIDTNMFHLMLDKGMTILEKMPPKTSYLALAWVTYMKVSGAKRLGITVSICRDIKAHPLMQIFCPHPVI